MKSMSWINEGQGRKSWYSRWSAFSFLYNCLFIGLSGWKHAQNTDILLSAYRKCKFNHKKDIYIHSNRHILAIILNIYCHRIGHILPPCWIYTATMIYICPPNCSISSSQDIVFIPGADLPYAPGILNSPHSSEALIPRDRASKPWRQSLWTVGTEPAFFLNRTFILGKIGKLKAKQGGFSRCFQPKIRWTNDYRRNWMLKASKYIKSSK